MNRQIATATIVFLAAGCGRTTTVDTSAPATQPTGAPTVFEYTQLAPMPDPRQEATGAVLNGKLYVIGGILDADHSTVDIVNVYDPATNTWTSAPPIPAPRHHAWAATLNGKLYVVGGYESLDRPWPARNTLFEFDPARNTWATKSPMLLARGALAVASYGGRLYAFGGATPQQQLSATEIYDPASDTWTAGAPMPTAREHIAVDVVGDRIHIMAGRAPRPGMINNFNMLEVYTPATNSWQTLAPVPTARSGLASAVLNDRIYAFGGEQAGGVFREAEEYDVATNTWRAVTPMPQGRTGLVVAAIGNAIYLIGGAGTEGAGSRTERFTVR